MGATLLSMPTTLAAGEDSSCVVSRHTQKMLAGHKAFLDKKYELEKKQALQAKVDARREEEDICRRVAEDKQRKKEQQMQQQQQQQQHVKMPMPMPCSSGHSNGGDDGMPEVAGVRDEAEGLLQRAERKRLHELRWLEQQQRNAAAGPGAEVSDEQ